jgi:hypothetical protein
MGTVVVQLCNNFLRFFILFFILFHVFFLGGQDCIWEGAHRTSNTGVQTELVRGRKKKFFVSDSSLLLDQCCGSGAYLPPGSGIRIRDELFLDPGSFWLRLLFWSWKHKKQEKSNLNLTFNVGSGMKKCLDPNPGFGMGKWSDPGSGIKHPGSVTLLSRYRCLFIEGDQSYPYAMIFRIRIPNLDGLVSKIYVIFITKKETK